MSHQYHLIAETDAREIEWEYDTPRDAYRAWRQITATGRTHDTGCKVRRASLWRDGELRESWRASADIIPFGKRAA